MPICPKYAHNGHMGIHILSGPFWQLPHIGGSHLYHLGSPYCLLMKVVYWWKLSIDESCLLMKVVDESFHVDESCLLMKVVYWWKLSTDESCLLMKVVYPMMTLVTGMARAAKKKRKSAWIDNILLRKFWVTYNGWFGGQMLGEFRPHLRDKLLENFLQCTNWARPVREAGRSSWVIEKLREVDKVGPIS